MSILNFLNKEKFTAVSSPPPGTAYFRRFIQAKNGESLRLQRIVPLSGGGMRAYYFGRRSGIRGGTPEMIGQGGFVFDIPKQYTTSTKTVPTADEVELWVDTIIRLWDDEPFYAQASQNALAEAERWHPQRLASIYREFFSSIFRQPASPLVPKDE